MMTYIDNTGNQLADAKSFIDLLLCSLLAENLVERKKLSGIHGTVTTTAFSYLDHVLLLNALKCGTRMALVLF